MDLCSIWHKASALVSTVCYSLKRRINPSLQNQSKIVCEIKTINKKNVSKMKQNIASYLHLKDVSLESLYASFKFDMLTARIDKILNDICILEHSRWSKYKLLSLSKIQQLKSYSTYGKYCS